MYVMKPWDEFFALSRYTTWTWTRIGFTYLYCKNGALKVERDTIKTYNIFVRMYKLLIILNLQRSATFENKKYTSTSEKIRKILVLKFNNLSNRTSKVSNLARPYIIYYCNIGILNFQAGILFVRCFQKLDLNTE